MLRLARLAVPFLFAAALLPAQEAPLAQPAEGAPDDQVRVIALTTRIAGDLAATLRQFLREDAAVQQAGRSAQTVIASHEGSNSLLLSGDAARLQALQGLVRHLDVAPAQGDGVPVEVAVEDDVEGEQPAADQGVPDDVGADVLALVPLHHCSAARHVDKLEKLLGDVGLRAIPLDNDAAVALRGPRHVVRAATTLLEQADAAADDRDDLMVGVVDLEHVAAAAMRGVLLELHPVAGNRPDGFRVAVVTPNRLVVRGLRDDVKRAHALLKLLDTPPPAQ